MSHVVHPPFTREEVSGTIITTCLLPTSTILRILVPQGSKILENHKQALLTSSLVKWLVSDPG